MKKKWSSLKNKAVAVIYAGGGGTRLWPVSTQEHPKQINAAFASETLVVQALKRARELFPPERILLVVTKDLARKVQSLSKLPKENYLVQPSNADTAAAMALAAIFIETHFPGSTAVTFYSDHLIDKPEHYFTAITHGVEVVNKTQSLLTIGTKPTLPSPDFGYIKLGKKLPFDDAFVIDEFVEKPTEDKAKKMIATKKYVWNTGVYIWQAETLLSLIKKVNPKMYEDLLQIKIAFGSSEYWQCLKDWYERVDHESFDKAVSEKTKDLVVVVAQYSWQDVGNWKTIYEISNKDKNGNAVTGTDDQSLVALKAKNCLVFSDKKNIALIGVEDLVIVENKDKLLVCHQSQVQKVKEAAKLSS